MEIPPKRVTGDTLRDRLTENAYERILPARYLLHDEDGEQIEEQEDLFERVAKNVAVAEAVWTDEDVTIRPDQIKPDHPRREELVRSIFPEDYEVQPLREDNAKWVAYDELVPHLEDEGWDETAERVEEVKQGFQEAMEFLDFIPNSPTLMNAGGDLQQLSACFVDSPEDDMESIHETAKEAAQVFQSGGGMGYAFWKLRPYGDPVGSTGGIASGPITFMRTYDQMCETIAQGGTRRGAQMAIMRVSHPDVIQFIHAKNKDVSLANSLRLNDPDDFTHNSFSAALEEARELIKDGQVPEHLRNAAEGHLSNFNISVGLTEDFMEAVKNGEEYTFKNPRTGKPHVATEHTEELYSQFGLGEHVEPGEVLSVPAEEVWERIIEGAHENGEPGTVFLDRINDDHSFPVSSTPGGNGSKYEILATNPCGEQPLMEYEACNLGHINLSTVVAEDAPDWREFDGAHSGFENEVSAFLNEALDWEELEERVEVGTQFLDNVVTMSAFPIEDIEETVRKNRKIGLGIMGLAQMFVQLGVRYGTEEANEMARQIMRRINHSSKWVSHELAEERGEFENWDDSKYADPTSYSEWFERQVGQEASRWSGGFKLRNHNTTTIAPTGTTSMVGNTSGGCEPIYNVVYRKNVSDDVQGDEMLAEADDYFLRVLEANDISSEAVLTEAAKQIRNNEFGGIDTLDRVPDELGELFVTTDELSAMEHASVQCALQEGVDSAISKTVNAPHDSSLDDARQAFEYIYENGGKGVTYYRDGTRSKQVLTTREDNQAVGEMEDGEVLEAVRERKDNGEFVEELIGVADLEHWTEGENGDSLQPVQVPEQLRGTRYPISTTYGQLSVKVFENGDGRPIEVWADVGKSGGFTNSFTEALGRSISIGLRAGVDPQEYIEQLDGISGPEVSWHKGEKLESIPDAVAWVMEKHINEEPMPSNVTPETSTDGGAMKDVVDAGANPECPDCGNLSVEMKEGCETCEDCGWSKC